MAPAPPNWAVSTRSSQLLASRAGVIVSKYLPAAHQAIPPANITAAAVCKALPPSDVVADSVIVTVVLERRLAYAGSVRGSQITVPVCPSTTVVATTLETGLSALQSLTTGEEQVVANAVA